MFQHTTAPPARWKTEQFRYVAPTEEEALSPEDKEEILGLWNSGLSAHWINVEHGWPVTLVRQVLRECRVAGRYVRRGEDMYKRYVLTAAQVKEIQQSHKSSRELCRKYGVAKSTIQRARSGKYFD